MLTPRPYQLVGRDFLAGRRHALLADEMRVGKTPQAILAAKEVLAQRTLVICPAIGVMQWNAEWMRWWPQAGCHPIVVSYDRARINAEGLKAEKWDLLIVDEAHFAKNPEAIRTKLIYGKDGLGWRADRLWALSGTPAPKHAGELWPMLRAFGTVGMDYEQFTRRYCDWNEYLGRIVGTKAEHIDELKALLAKVMLRRMRKDVAPDMPAIDFQFLEVEPEVKKDLKVPPGLSDGQLLEWMAANQTAVKEDRILAALAKIKPLGDEIESALTGELYKQTVVFGWHIEPLEMMVRSLRARGFTAELINGQTPDKQKQNAIAAFKAGQVQVICANILTAGTSIDLSAASHGYFLELDWVPGNNVQAANRLISMDKAEPVTIDVATWHGSTDDRTQRVLLRRVAELAKLY